DLGPLLRGESDAEVRETHFYYRGETLYAVRRGPWKAHFITQWAYTPGSAASVPPTPELYNLDVDPSEQYDLSERHPEIIEEIRRAVAEHEAGLVRVPSRLEARIETAAP